MIPDGTYTAVVDRIEDGLATLELTPVADECGRDRPVADESGTDRERYSLVVCEEHLPADGRHADAVLAVTLADEALEEATYDPGETGARAGAAQDRFDRLSDRPPSDDQDG